MKRINWHVVVPLLIIAVLLIAGAHWNLLGPQ
jgi:hypothetical protein